MSMRQRLCAVLCSIAAFTLFQPAFASGAEPSAQAIPFKQDKTAVEDGLPKMVLGLLICGALFAGAIVVLRKRMGGVAGASGSKRNLRILESQRLTTRSSLHVVEFRGNYYLLSQSEAGIRRLASSPVESAPLGDEK